MVVTVNPGPWDGDHRLWEALASGALVLSDKLLVPLREPLVDGKHLVLYDNNNRSTFMSRLWEAVGGRGADRASRIAGEGRDHALLHHRMVVRVDWVLSVLTKKEQGLVTRCVG